MVRVRYIADGGHYRVGGVGFDPGDEKDVDEELAEHLEDVGEFEVVDDAGEGLQFDPGEVTDFSSNGWLENDYQDRADAVREGGLDDYLDEIETAETSDTVLDAVEQRRDELEE